MNTGSSNPPRETSLAKHKQGLAARSVAVRLITRVIDDGRNLDALCDRVNGLKEFLSLDLRDQGLARAIAVTALRNRNHIDLAMRTMMDRPPPKRARLLIHSIHAALAQILFMDVPDSAAVNLGVTQISADERTARFKGLANAVLRRATREKERLLSEKFQTTDPFPKWFSNRLRKDYGKKRLTTIAKAISQRPGIDITVKSNAADWADKLDGEVLPTGGIRLKTDIPVTDLEGFNDGEWWVQDAAASVPTQLLDAEPGTSVLELCAAPGGKTAQLINSGYKVTALDISQVRLKRLQENLSRLNMKATLVQADILEWETEEQFDSILLDAPCSSTGTVRRHPDVLWSRTDEEIRELAELQYKLVIKSLEFLKPGGSLVFSNCSIFKEEGEDLLARLLRSDLGIINQKLTPKDTFDQPALINGQGAMRSLPDLFTDMDGALSSGLDGFFACKLVKPA